MSLKDVKSALQVAQTQLAQRWQWANQVEASWAPGTRPAELAEDVKGEVTKTLLLLIPVQAACGLNFLEREQARWQALTRKGADPK